MSSSFPLYRKGFCIASPALPVFRQHVHLSAVTCLRGYLGVHGGRVCAPPSSVISRGTLVSPSARWGRDLVACTRRARTRVIPSARDCAVDSTLSRDAREREFVSPRRPISGDSDSPNEGRTTDRSRFDELRATRDIASPSRRFAALAGCFVKRRSSGLALNLPLRIREGEHRDCTIFERTLLRFAPLRSVEARS